MVNDLNHIIKKWSSIISNMTDINNKTILVVLSLYAEIYSSIDMPIDYTMQSPYYNREEQKSKMFKESLSKIVDKILTCKKLRVKIISEYYNYMKCEFEYQLEDGTFISKEKMTKDIYFSENELIDIFGNNYYREMRTLLIEANIIPNGR